MALRAAAELLTLAQDAGIGAESPEQLSKTFGQQVAESGLLHCIPELCELAAQHLTTAAAAAAAAAGCDGRQNTCGGASSGSSCHENTASSSNSSTGRDVGLPQMQAGAQQADVRMAALVLRVVAAARESTGTNTQAEVCVKSVAQLTCVGLHYLSCLAQQQSLQQQQQQQVEARSSHESRPSTAQWLLHKDIRRLVPQLERIAVNMLSTDHSQFWARTFLQLHCYRVAVLAVRPVLQQHAATAKAATADSSPPPAAAAAGTVKAASTNSAAAATQHRLHQQQQQQQSQEDLSQLPAYSEHGWLPGQLSPLVPAPVSRLLQQLGYSRELVLWGAYEGRSAALSEELNHIGDLQYNMLKFQEAVLVDEQHQQRRQQQQHPTQILAARERLLCWLLADVMLHWLAMLVDSSSSSSSSSSSDITLPAQCTYALNIAATFGMVAMLPSQGDQHDRDTGDVYVDGVPTTALECVAVDEGQCYATLASPALTVLCDRYRQRAGTTSSSSSSASSSTSSPGLPAEGLLDLCTSGATELYSMLLRSLMGLKVKMNTCGICAAGAAATQASAAAARRGESSSSSRGHGGCVAGEAGGVADDDTIPSHRVLVPAVHHSAQSAGQVCVVLQDVVRLLIQASQNSSSSTASSSVRDIGSSIRDAMYKEQRANVIKHVGELLLPSDNIAGQPLVDPITSASPADPCSPHHLQLYGLLCSLVKLDGSDNSLRLVPHKHRAPLGSVLYAHALFAITTVLETAVRAVKPVTAQGSAVGATAAGAAARGPAAAAGQKGTGNSQQPPAQQGMQGGSGSSTCSSSSHSGDPTDASGAVVNLAVLTPWLSLVGRCCVHIAAKTQGALARRAAAVAAEQNRDGVDDALLRYWDLMALYIHAGRLSEGADVLLAWLSNVSAARQVTAAGCDVQALLVSLLGVRQAGEQFDHAEGYSESMAGVLSGFVEWSAKAGAALCCFAHPHACNNPLCGNVAGPSEAQLVGGRSCICAGCRTARHCGKACQRQHWKQHKPVCKALAAAAAAVAGDL